MRQGTPFFMTPGAPRVLVLSLIPTHPVTMDKILCLNCKIEEFKLALIF